ncbi:MAG: alpha/beta hydrolase [Gloeotrichia echinulata IR180]|jgi:pimeloyl-ACP methyl ester carboxylesterase|nr:alpha/beta hydrolase [Gloeotrichia echinulata DEX184]
MTTASTQFYTWQNYRCAYEVHHPTDSTAEGIPLLLIHPIGVGLSRQFWQRFVREWYNTGNRRPIYNPDLLGCGDSDMPHVAYTPSNWAEQLHYFLQKVVQQPVIVVVQGALLPVALELVQKAPNLIHSLVFAGPPAWAVMTKKSPTWQQKLTWNLLDSPLGNAFYRYARTPKFLRSFSTRQLFASGDSVDSLWLNTLVAGAEKTANRYAVFSFLAGFWRQDYSTAIAAIKQATLVVVGETASSISQEGKRETPDQRLADYLAHLPHGRGIKLPGRNVLPYESTAFFVGAIAPFVNEVG